MANKCEHDRMRSRCKECGGGSICDHGRVRGSCSLCAPEQVFNMYRRNAIKRGLSFELTVYQFIAIVRCYCVFCGENSAPRGVDRRDNNKGYLHDNCQSCCGPCNKLKSAESEQTFLRLILKIAKHQEGLQTQKALNPPVPPQTSPEPTKEPTVPSDPETLEQGQTELSIQLRPRFRIHGPAFSAEARRYLDGL